MIFEELSPELQEKVKACKSMDELKELAQIQDIELSEEFLNSVSGGLSTICYVVCNQYDDLHDTPPVL